MRARQCRSCKTRIPFNARFCPYCYKPQWGAIVAMTAAVAVLFVSVGGVVMWKSRTPAVTSEQVGAEVPEEAQQVQSMPTWKKVGREGVVLPGDTGKEEILVPVIEPRAVGEQTVTRPEEPEKENAGRMHTVQKKEEKPPPVPASTVKTRREKPRPVEARAEKSTAPQAVAQPPSVRKQHTEAERERAEPSPVRAEGVKAEEKAVAEDPVPAGGRSEGQKEEVTSPPETQAGGPEVEAPIGDLEAGEASSLEAQTEKSGIINTETQ